MRWWAGGGSSKAGSGGGFGRVSPSHIGSGAWMAWPAIVGGGDKPWALKILILFLSSAVASSSSALVHSLCLRGV